MNSCREPEALKRHKPETIMVEIHWKNTAAIPLYYQDGSRISGLSRNKFGTGQDAIFLELDTLGSR